MRLSVSAPGKLMLSGEYAVLDGAPAVVAAVDARARATLSDAATTAPAANVPPEVEGTWRLARARFPTLPAAPPAVDVSALRDPSGAQKLGLGSSAAAAAATAGLALAHAGRTLGDASTRAELFALAFEGHRVIAPEGSGADVAASSLGGYLRFQAPRPTPGASGLPSCRALHAPAGLLARVVWTGSAARTSDLVAQVRAFGAREPAAFARRAAELAETADAFASAFERGALTDLLTLTSRYHDAMLRLGEAAGAPIVEARLGTLASLARASGGAAKPSGAGGGDVAIAFFTDPRDAARFDERVSAQRFETLPLALGADGPRTG